MLSNYDVKNGGSYEDSGNACAGRIFYLVSIHNDRTLADALYLFRAIRHARNIIVIHIEHISTLTFGL